MSFQEQSINKVWQCGTVKHNEISFDTTIPALKIPPPKFHVSRIVESRNNIPVRRFVMGRELKTARKA